MIPRVHYLVRSPTALGQLLYPTEVDDDYQSFGTFFFLGETFEDVREYYVFFAVLNGDVIAPNLARVGGSSIYRSAVEGVGRFEFTATIIGAGGLYAGAYYPPEGMYAVRQLEVRSHLALDSAARHKNFFFTGYTPERNSAV